MYYMQSRREGLESDFTHALGKIHTDAFTQRRFYRLTLLRMDAFTHRPLSRERKDCSGTSKIANFKFRWLPLILCKRVARREVKSHFCFSFCGSTLVSRGRVVLAKGNSQFFLSFWWSTVPKGCSGSSELAILPQFLRIAPHFVRKGCSSTF